MKWHRLNLYGLGVLGTAAMVIESVQVQLLRTGFSRFIGNDFRGDTDLTFTALTLFAPVFTTTKKYFIPSKFDWYFIPCALAHTPLLAVVT